MLALTREKLLTHLQEVSRLVNMYQQRDPSFAQKAIAWSQHAEDTLLQLRSPLASLVSASRAKMLAASDGYCHPAISMERTRRRRKMQPATIAMILSEMESPLRNRIDDIDAKLGTWREKMVQFIAVATADDPIPLPPTEPREEWLKMVWRNFKVSPKTQGMYNYLNTVMSRMDRLYLLNELIENLLGND